MEKNDKTLSKIITLNFRQRNYQFSTELIKPLHTFYDEVCAYLQINSNNFNLYYNNKKLTMTGNNRTISDIIEADKDPYFSIIAQKKNTPYKLKLRYDLLENNSNKNNVLSTRKNNQPRFLTITTKDKKVINNNNNLRYINCTNINDGNPRSIGVVLSQIPSVRDIEKMLKNFNSDQDGQNNSNNIKTNNRFNLKQGVLTVLGNNSVRVDFQDEMTLNKFISYISFMKYENSYYKNIIIQKDNSEVKKKGKNLSLSQKNIRIYFSNLNHKYYNGNTNKKDHSCNININDVIKALKEHELKNDCYHGLCLKREGENNIITDYYQQQNFVRNSSPYISEDEKRILEERENKKKFIDKKNKFVTSVGKYSMKPNFIPNYVGMTPSENPNEHSFREVDKKKWITIKGFNV